MEKHFSRLFVVDDEPKLANIIRRHHGMEGYEVNMAYEVLEALETIIAAGEANIQFDLVITDVNMPGFDGIALIKWLCRPAFTCRTGRMTSEPVSWWWTSTTPPSVWLWMK